MKVLVAYATKHGATKGIAERIRDTLAREGLEADLRSVDDAISPEEYDAFVVGSAAYMYHWLKEASRFVRVNKELLASRPTWLFTSGPVGTDLVDAKGRDVIEAAKPAEFAEFAEEIEPVDEKVFFGAYYPEAPPIGLAERIGTFFIRSGLVKEALPAGDFRDWPEIEAWAVGIARELEELRVPVTA